MVDIFDIYNYNLYGKILVIRHIFSPSEFTGELAFSFSNDIT
jgi:hypothetical protein